MSSSIFQSSLRWLGAAWVALLLGAVVSPAAAAPYYLCASLADSSGVDGGTTASECGFSDSVEKSLESTTFGNFSGTARGNSSSFDQVGLYASATFGNYQSGSYVAGPSGIDFAASAAAYLFDRITISAPYAQVWLVVDWTASGTIEQSGVSGQLCYGLSLGANLSGPCIVGLPPLITAWSEGFAPDGTTRDAVFSFSAVVFNHDEDEPSPYDASASVDLEHTLTMLEMRVTSASGEPLRGVTLSSANGYAYPLSPINLLPVPEPATWASLLAGLAVIGWRRRAARGRG